MNYLSEERYKKSLFEQVCHYLVLRDQAVDLLEIYKDEIGSITDGPVAQFG
jgi:hypothetical protein